MAVSQTAFDFKGCTNFYSGKVRDVYTFGDRIAMVTSDRISAFDVILPRPIPGKGQILNSIAAFFLRKAEAILPTWLEATPHPSVMIGKKCQPFKVEMVIRGYLTGHAWRTYKSGSRELCGVPLPEGLHEHDPLPSPIITPSTKAETGHDEDISAAEIVAQGLASPEHYAKLEAYTQQLFKMGTDHAAEQGLILVDTKYEFGLYNGQIVLMDEIHTPDSSRYFYAEGYAERQRQGAPQKQLSKEFVREWLMERGFQGKKGQTVPEMSDEFVDSVSLRYQELYKQIIGKKFDQPLVTDTQPIASAINHYFDRL